LTRRPEADVLYTSDLHGHEPLYHEALAVARHFRARALILGGDLAPHADPPRQTRFYRSFLLPILRNYLAEPGSADIYYVFGNDDWRASGATLENAGIQRLTHAHGRVLPFLDGTYLAGLASVPVTPFGMKDWDRWEDRLSPAARLDGFRSRPDGTLEPFDFRGREAEESLARDLDEIGAAVPRGKRLLCVFHGPPYGTACDQVARGVHVGSHETRRFLERVRPLLGLHGHIHESPAVSGKFVDRIGPTICVNPGQRMGSALHAVTFRLADVAGTLTHTLLGPARLSSG
jgi:Icc-related predicted phosphoesterase